jgi:hypothetical protein
MIPLLITGGGVLAALITLAMYRIALRRYHRTWLKPHNDPEICIYLHDGHVMNMYRQGEYKALKQEVELRTRRNREARLSAQARGVGAQVGQESEEEKVIKFIQDEEPITAIRSIMTDLERARNIVYIDLLNKSLEPGGGLDRALPGRKGPRQRAIPMWDLNPFVFVSIKGKFRLTDRTGTTTTFSMPYGNPADPESESWQVCITCVTAHLRLTDIPAGPFPARCLGKIQNWDRGTKTLVIDPVLAIFQ